MTEPELRALVRDAIARHTGGGATASLAPLHAAPMRPAPSHQMFILPVGMDSDGPCIIEPAVQCNHCGYCKSYGH